MSGYKNNKAWRKKHPFLWQNSKRRYYKQFEAAACNGNQGWVTNEMEMIMNKRNNDRKIASMIGRTVKAIQVERAKLKKRNFQLPKE